MDAAHADIDSREVILHRNTDAITPLLSSSAKIWKIIS